MTALIVAGVIVGLLLVGGIPALLWFTVGADMRRAKVLAQGEAGMARILGWERTGVSHGPHDILRFTLAILPRSGGPEFQATAKRLVVPMEVPLFQIGMQRPVRVLRDGQRLLVELE